MKSRLLTLFLVLVWLVPTLADHPTAEQKAVTIKFLQPLQLKDGGFCRNRIDPALTSDLGSTSSGLRALKYFGGECPNKEAAQQFVKSCYDKASGGFAAKPGGTPDVRTTAIGIMAVVELKMHVEEYSEGVVKYLSTNVKTFEDIRIAAAGLDTIKAKTPKAKEWIAEVEKMRNPDGTYGKGGNVARDTASAVVTILRLGGTLENKDAVVKALKAGQRDDGGWFRDGEKSSDLETTYRVMRAFVMLKEKPNVSACRDFVAKQRRDDGSYGTPNAVSTTYFAGIVLHWLDEMK